MSREQLQVRITEKRGFPKKISLGVAVGKKIWNCPWVRDFVYIGEGNLCFILKGLIYSLRYLISNSQSQTFSSCSSAEMDGSNSYEGSQFLEPLRCTSHINWNSWFWFHSFWYFTLTRGSTHSLGLLSQKINWVSGKGTENFSFCGKEAESWKKIGIKWKEVENIQG